MERRCAERPDTVDELAARATTVDDNPLTLPSPQGERASKGERGGGGGASWMPPAPAVNWQLHHG